MKTISLMAVASAIAISVAMAPAMAKSQPGKTVAPVVATTPARQAKVVDNHCRTKSPGQFDSVHEYTCAFEVFKAESITLGDPAKMAEFVKLWEPKVWIGSELLKMDGVSEDQRKINTFALIRRMRDFTHERFDYVNSPEQSAAIQKEIVHPTLQGGIGAVLRLGNMADIEMAIFAGAPKEGMTRDQYKVYQDKLNAASIIGPDHQLLIDVPIQGSPSWGFLRSGDIIVGVDSTTIAGMQMDKVITDLIRGAPGTPVVIHVLRKTDSGLVMPLDFHLVRTVVDQHTVFSRDVDGIRHITVGDFENDYVLDDFYQAVKEAKDKGMKGIDVDLRNDPGGRLDYVMAMLELVVPRGLILTTVYRDTGSTSSTQTDYVMADGYGLTTTKAVGAPDNAKQIDAQPRVPYTAQYGEAVRRNPNFVTEHPLLPIIDEDMPLTVEINVNSYSASEIFAGAIQATHRGTIVGEPSAGKGAIMGEIPLPEGGSLAVTSGQFYPGGIDTKLKGILPDRAVKASQDYGKTDPQRDAASAVIEEEHARILARKALATERTTVNSARFEEEMRARDQNDALPPAEQAPSN